MYPFAKHLVMKWIQVSILLQIWKCYFYPHNWMESFQKALQKITGQLSSPQKGESSVSSTFFRDIYTPL